MKAVTLPLLSVALCGAVTLAAFASGKSPKLDPLLVDPNVSIRSDGANLPADLEKDFKALHPEGSRKPASANEHLDRLLTNPAAKILNAQSTLPDDLSKDFTVLGPEDASTREPASNKARGKGASKGKASPSKGVAGAARGPAPGGRQSRLPKAVLDGIEMRIRYAGLVSTFWVAKRGDRFDLVYANNQGSKASVGLTSDQFRALHNTALGTPAGNGPLSKCPNASIQMYVVTAKKPERVLASCADAKGKSAEGLRNIANVFAAMVR